jgi:hypothetical protein
VGKKIIKTAPPLGGVFITVPTVVKEGSGGRIPPE